MERVMWKPIRTVFCERVGREVTLEAQQVLPEGYLSDQPPRILAHRCSLGFECNQIEEPTCRWAGTLPGYDPFAAA